ncbi:hypothetical protein QBC38DRAFT_464893 [Podospora fimiseda]|uniref:Uncharacterized protein n=1 Tax=Podospora fimiseda TaxID=252190 RepID=A0AAN7BYC4_9PEZI|nr:hypothetical protein QBC38DRAFT_464893 [Podospora fimiseda]
MATPGPSRGYQPVPLYIPGGGPPPGPVPAPLPRAPLISPGATPSYQLETDPAADSRGLPKDILAFLPNVASHVDYWNQVQQAWNEVQYTGGIMGFRMLNHADMVNFGLSFDNPGRVYTNTRGSQLVTWWDQQLRHVEWMREQTQGVANHYREAMNHLGHHFYKDPKVQAELDQVRKELNAARQQITDTAAISQREVQRAQQQAAMDVAAQTQRDYDELQKKLDAGFWRDASAPPALLHHSNPWVDVRVRQMRTFYDYAMKWSTNPAWATPPDLTAAVQKIGGGSTLFNRINQISMRVHGGDLRGDLAIVNNAHLINSRHNQDWYEWFRLALKYHYGMLDPMHFKTVEKALDLEKYDNKSWFWLLTEHERFISKYVTVRNADISEKGKIIKENTITEPHFISIIEGADQLFSLYVPEFAKVCEEAAKQNPDQPETGADVQFMQGELQRLVGLRWDVYEYVQKNFYPLTYYGTALRTRWEQLGFSQFNYPWQVMDWLAMPDPTR